MKNIFICFYRNFYRSQERQLPNSDSSRKPTRRARLCFFVVWRCLANCRSSRQMDCHCSKVHHWCCCGLSSALPTVRGRGPTTFWWSQGLYRLLYRSKYFHPFHCMYNRPLEFLRWGGMCLVIYICRKQQLLQLMQLPKFLFRTYFQLDPKPTCCLID